jgi:4-alpha-glucanotransferase
MKRASGILLPVASLPSEYGIGCFDECAYEFIDRLASAGQSYWQILPMGPTGYGDSPYQSFSTFAGNPYFISLKELVKKGYLTEQDCNQPGADDKYIRYDLLYQNRFRVLRKAFAASAIETDKGYNKFVQDNADWLPDYALFMAIKDAKSGQSFLEWEEPIRRRESQAMVSYKNKLLDDVNFYQFLQYEFSCQWQKLKSYANEKGIQIIGDIPIYVALDSADVWANPALFQLDKNGTPIGVAGCPPDAFSATGQLWGNPLYNWKKHKETGYQWWISRIRNCYTWYDMVRIDHFRGFDEYYAIPYGDSTAEFGKWEPGPGMDLFEALKRELGELSIIAEDLGFLTDSVRKLLADSGFPGMKVLQFAFDSREDSDYLPYHYGRNSVVYTGTHDNATTFSWWKELPPADKSVALRYMNRKKSASRKKLTWNLVCLAMSSVSDLCIVPMQDYLCLPNTARINMPSTLGGNWQWRMEREAFTVKLAEKIRRMTKLYGRCS